MKLDEEKLAPNFNSNAACRLKRIMLAFPKVKGKFC